jgi:hypothetical protein
MQEPSRTRTLKEVTLGRCCFFYAFINISPIDPIGPSLLPGEDGRPRGEEGVGFNCFSRDRSEVSRTCLSGGVRSAPSFSGSLLGTPTNVPNLRAIGDAGEFSNLQKFISLSRYDAFCYPITWKTFM